MKIDELSTFGRKAAVGDSAGSLDVEGVLGVMSAFVGKALILLRFVGVAVSSETLPMEVPRGPTLRTIWSTLI